jgi:hypothetical protein
MATIVTSKYTPAIVLFVVFLFVYVTVWAIRYFGHDTPYVRRFPPWLSPCPDYWTHYDGKCYRMTTVDNGRVTCGPAKNQYNSDAGPPPAKLQSYTATDNPTRADAKGLDMNAATWEEKCKWTKSCDVYWEGVSNQDCDGDAFADWN